MKRIAFVAVALALLSSGCGTPKWDCTCWVYCDPASFSVDVCSGSDDYLGAMTKANGKCATAEGCACSCSCDETNDYC